MKLGTKNSSAISHAIANYHSYHIESNENDRSYVYVACCHKPWNCTYWDLDILRA